MEYFWPCYSICCTIRCLSFIQMSHVSNMPFFIPFVFCGLKIKLAVLLHSRVPLLKICKDLNQNNQAKKLLRKQAIHRKMQKQLRTLYIHILNTNYFKHFNENGKRKIGIFLAAKSICHLSNAMFKSHPRVDFKFWDENVSFRAEH